MRRELWGHIQFVLTEQGRRIRDAIEERTDDANFAYWPTGASLYALSQSVEELMRDLR